MPLEVLLLQFLKIAGSGYILHFPFGAIGPLGLHESGCNLEFQLHPYWLALELLVGGGPGFENLARLQFGKWRVAFARPKGPCCPPPPNSDWMVDVFA